MKFTKMHGTGNDFIIIEDMESSLTLEESNLAKKLCHRRFGIGADGLILVKKSNIAQIKMVIINSDGSYANMCGNGIRCFAKYVYERNIIKDEELVVETGDGNKVIRLEIEDNKVKNIIVNMGKISFSGELIPLKNRKELIDEEIFVNGKSFRATSILLGVPHTVIFNDNDDYNVEEGKYIEKHNLFLEGTNVNFIKVINKNNIEVETWERGAGKTFSCGTGCCASAVVCNKLGKTDEEITVKVPGGIVYVKIENNQVFMSGKAQFICEGVVL